MGRRGPRRGWEMGARWGEEMGGEAQVGAGERESGGCGRWGEDCEHT